MALLVKGLDRRRVKRLQTMVQRLRARDAKVTKPNVWSDFRTWKVTVDVNDSSLSDAFTAVDTRLTLLLGAKAA